MLTTVLRRLTALCAACILVAAIAACGDDETGQVQNAPANQVENANDDANDQNDDANDQNDDANDQNDDANDQNDDANDQNDDTNDDEPVVCHTNEECEDDEVCARTEPGAEGICTDPTDDLADGEACNEPEACNSGLCYFGTCTSECDEDEDCPDGWLCRDQEGDGYCQEPSSCSADDDCDYDGDRCVVDRNDDVDVVCNPPVGDGELGEACTDDDECSAGLCLDGQCSRPCDSPADCGDGDDYLCTGEDLGDGTIVPVCTERPPEVCVSDQDCDGDDRCVATVEDDDVIFACDEPNDDGAEGGADCTDDADCAQNLCEDGSCKAPCGDDDVCSDISGSECTTTTVERDDADGSVSVCTVPEPCDSTEDCTGDDACAIVPDASGDGLATVCLPDNDGQEVGEPCEDHDDCLSRACNESGFCSAPCTDDDHCHMYQTCQEDTFSKDDQEDELDHCVELPATECNATVDCDYDVQACNLPVFEDDELEGAACGLSNPGEASLGSSCDDSADCESNFCWPSEDGTTGECTVFCEEEQRDCADEQVCVPRSEELDLGNCLAGCSTNDDCDGDNVCQYVADTDEDELVQYCDNHVGDTEIGEECSASTECVTGSCLTVSTYSVTDDMCNDDVECDEEFECRCPPSEPDCDQEYCVSEEPEEEENRCTRLCEDDTDCEADGDHDMTRCSDTIVVTWDDGAESETISACSLEE